MRIRDPMQEAEEPFNLVPLTDMVFNLLIFFMAATTFAQVEKELGIRLPRTASGAMAASALPQQVIININAEGKPIVAKKEYDLKSLTDFLRGVLGKNPQTTVIIRADKRAVVEHFASVADACKAAGVQELKLSYVTGGNAP
jgi:biopolymer transport protein ExbD